MASEPFQRHFLTLESSLAAAGEASVWARTLAIQHEGVPAQRVDDLDLCVIELMNNVVDYAYGRGPGEIHLELDLRPEAVVLTIADEGAEFNPLALPQAGLPKSLDEAASGGFGVHLVRSFADACHYERRANRNHFSAYFGSSGELPRLGERRVATAHAFPVRRADGTVVARDARAGVDRRALGFISQCRMFLDVPYADLEGIVAQCRLVEYPTGAVVLEPGPHSSSVLVVVRGSLRVHLGGPASEDVVEIPCGDCVGEISVVDGKPISAWVVAAEASQLLVIEEGVFLERLLAIPRIARNMISLLGERMRVSNLRVVERVRGAAELQALQRELDFARRIQTSMLPASPLLAGCPDIECHGYMRAAQQVGGDFYDVLQQGPNRFFFAIGDVCNKGMPAALFMAQTLTLLRSEASAKRVDAAAHLRKLVNQCNDQLARSNEAQLFVTLYCVVVDVEAGKLHYVNAGHCPPVLILPGAPPAFLEGPRNPIAGLVPDLHYKAGSIDFPPGSALLLYTDGVTEAQSRDGIVFGEEPLFEALRIAPEDTTGIMKAVDEFVGEHPPFDDITLLLIRRTGGNPGTAAPLVSTPPASPATQPERG